MTEGQSPKATAEITTAAGAVRQRKKRKWDQPAESLIAAGVALQGGLPLGMIEVPGVSLPGVLPLASALLTNPIQSTFATASQLFQSSPMPNVAAVVHKLNQPKIQDELIAREIVINDAEPTIRYKLTKRQTQEEIQKSTGAVVITRGKYHPPNGPPDTEKPLYLHISAGAHLKDTAERIKAVDRAASMIEEIQQGPNPLPTSTPYNSYANTGQAIQPFSTCVFLGFDADPSLNVAARIRGPNDQYINHIMNETGATLVLRGRGSGNVGNSQAEETEQLLHFYLSSTTQKSLESARILAENLLDTICAECGATRISSCKVYGAVPPPQQMMNGVHSTTNILGANTNSVAGLPCTAASFTPAAAAAFAPSSFSLPPQNVLQPGVPPSYMTTQANIASYTRPLVTGGTCYSGYGGIYPQATPLQQVALALRQGPALTTTVASTTKSAGTLPKTFSSSSAEVDKRPPQRRKFQELPVSSKEQTTFNQNSLQEEFLKPGSDDPSVTNISSMPPPKKLVSPGSDSMLRPPPQNMPPPPPKFSASQSHPRAENIIPVTEKSPPRNMPPPPPKFSAAQSCSKADSRTPAMKKSTAEPVSDTLLKLVEYGEEDDDVDDSGDESPESHPTGNTTSKPFWAV